MGILLLMVTPRRTFTDVTTNNASAAKHGYLPKLENSGSKYLKDDGTWSTPAGGGGAANDMWYDVTGTRTGAQTFTFAGDAADAAMIRRSLFTCLSSGDVRRLGYVKSAAHAGGTVTVTVIVAETGDLATTVLEAGDKDFKISFNRKIDDYLRQFFKPGQIIGDTANPQGMRYYITDDSYIISCDVSARIPAAGVGAAMTVNFYADATALFSSAIDLGSSEADVENTPTAQNTIAAGAWLTCRLLTSAGATNFASDALCYAYVVPQEHYTGAA